jgi:hypothetical protein
MPGSDAVRIAAGGSKVYIVNTAGKMYKYSNNTWSQIVGSDARDIAVDNNGLTFITNTVGKIYQYSGNGYFNQLDGSDGKMVSANNGKLIMINTTGRIFYRQY